MLAFVTGLLERGEATLADPPSPERARAPLAPEVAALVAGAFDRHALDVAGPRIAFDLGFARRAAEIVELACWLLVRPAAPRNVLGVAGDALGTPRTASEHLSADLFLRYLPTIQRRARSLDANDPLGHEVALILRRFPLSGVLAGLADGPLEALDLGGHAGLALLYGERLAALEDGRAAPLAWTPPEGPVGDALELVLQDLGREGSPLLARREPAPSPGPLDAPGPADEPDLEGENGPS